MEALKKVSKQVGVLISTIIASLADKKVSITEGIGIFKDFSVLAWSIFKDRKELGTALADGISLQENQAFSEGFSEGFDIAEDDLEQSVEYYADLAAQLITTVANIFLLRNNEGEEDEDQPEDEDPADQDDKDAEEAAE